MNFTGKGDSPLGPNHEHHLFGVATGEKGGAQVIAGAETVYVVEDDTSLSMPSADC